ncbi:MAG: zinc metalloprotease HtpX [Chlamydiae bacterium]|nr:zinc metalloprotease HtpX [Chlamydiota bacterium]MBI3265607.1 zinc metalloprotease HtpX [Chlamydiota bacterium]
MNITKTTFLLALLTVLFVLAGGALGGQNGMVTAFIFALVMNVVTYFFCHKMVLMLYRAQPLSEGDAPEVYQMVRELTMKASLPMPQIYLIPQEAPNAFATGRSPEHAVVAVTRGIMNLLDKEELKGVLGHELSHVRNRDILVSTIAATIAGAISMVANMARWGMMFGGGRRSDNDRNNPIGLILSIVLLILLPFAAMLIQLAISRTREYGADESGAKLTGNPRGLASALRKLQMYSQKRPMTISNPATAHLFIVNPLSGKNLLRLFSTHPPIEERIQRLEKMV